MKIFLGDGHGAFQAPLDGPISSNVAAGLVIADFDKNGHPDVAVATSFGTSGASLLVLPGNGDGTFGTERDYGLGQASPQSNSLVVSDLDGDGRQDLALCSSNINSVFVLLGAGNGTFASPQTYGTGANSFPTSIAVGDVDGDGKPDVAFSSMVPAGVGLLRNKGDGSFAAPIVAQPLSSAPSLVAIGDMDGDGRMDLVYVVEDDVSHVVGISFAGVGGSLSAPVTTSADLNNATGMVLIDINGDHRPDVIITNRFGDMVQILRNDCGDSG